MPRSTSWEQVWSPSPSMSMAPRETKCRSLPWICAGQERFEQRVTAPSRWASAPQAGQCAGILNAGSPAGGGASAMARAIPGSAAPPREQVLVAGPHLIERIAALVLGIGPQPQLAELLELVPVRGEDQVAGIADIVEEDGERALGGLARIELPQRARRGIARVDEGRFAGRLALLVELHEIGL